MIQKKKIYFLRILTLCLITSSCVEPFDFETIDFEDVLVVEATITNELKYQEINLTRTFKFEENTPAGERNAGVTITDDLQNNYLFDESVPGKYISTTEFRAQPNRVYRLSITTQDGSSYSSLPSQLPQVTQIDELFTARETNADGMDGVTIYVNSFDPTGNSRLYRYEYEETYLVIAPFASSIEEVVILSDEPPYSIDRSVTTQPKTKEEQICYNTLFNNNVLQTQTLGLQEDRVSRFPIRFLSSNNPTIRDRYSIKVKQYVQTSEAYNYYKVLNELSSSESLLSQNQPGFINGNIIADNNPNEKVVGYFEITSVSSNRLFFNYRAIFPDVSARPSYFYDCTTESPLQLPLMVDDNDPNNSPLINKIKSDTLKHFETITDLFGNIDPITPYLMVDRNCGDCTVFGTNIKPDFWID